MADGKRYRGRLILRAVAPDDEGFLSALQDAGLLTESLSGPNSANFAFAGKSGEPVAYGGYTVLGGLSMLRSVVVLPQWRSQGVGARMVTALISQLQGINIKSVYLLTENADMFFSDLGFSAIARSDAPQVIQETRQFAHHCPEDAVLMARPLDEMMRLGIDDIHPVPRGTGG